MCRCQSTQRRALNSGVGDVKIRRKGAHSSSSIRIKAAFGLNTEGKTARMRRISERVKSVWSKLALRMSRRLRRRPGDRVRSSLCGRRRALRAMRRRFASRVSWSMALGRVDRERRDRSTCGSFCSSLHWLRRRRGASVTFVSPWGLEGPGAPILETGRGQCAPRAAKASGGF